MSIYQVLLSFLVGAGFFGIHIFLRQISSKFRTIDDQFSGMEIQIIANQISVFYNNISNISFTSPIRNEYGYIAVSNKEISRVYAAAPPCAPPENQPFTAFQVYEILQDLIPPVLDELQEIETQLKKDEIRQYVIQKLVSKVVKNQRSYPLNFAENLNNFTIFEKNIKFAITRQILPTLALAAKRENKKAEVIMKNAVAAYTRKSEIDIDADLTATSDGKSATLHDIIPSHDPEPLEILLAQEKEKIEQAVLDDLSEVQKARLIAEFDERRRVETGELFEVEQIETVKKPVKPAYRRQPKPLAAAQPLLFHQGVAL
jgi:hypothetical protein